MRKPKCDVCGRPAAIRETALEDGTVRTRHLCAEHGEATWQAAVPPLGDADAQAGALRDLEEHWRSLTQAEQEHLAELFRRTRRYI